MAKYSYYSDNVTSIGGAGREPGTICSDCIWSVDTGAMAGVLPWDLPHLLHGDGHDSLYS